jgi:hypothetical protein
MQYRVATHLLSRKIDFKIQFEMLRHKLLCVGKREIVVCRVVTIVRTVIFGARKQQYYSRNENRMTQHLDAPGNWNGRNIVVIMCEYCGHEASPETGIYHGFRRKRSRTTYLEGCSLVY